MARICVVNIQAEESARLFTYYAEMVASRVLRPESTIGIKCPEPGVTRIYDTHPYFRFLNTREIVEKMVQADREGYDAIVVHCFADPGVQEARGVVDVPVVGPGEASLHLACLLGQRFAIITINDPAGDREIEAMVDHCGLRGRAIAHPLRPMTLPLRDFAHLSLEAATEAVVPDVLAKARECVADGADVVILGCTGLSPLLTLAGIGQLPETEVPLLDCLAVALKTAETLVDLRQALGLPAISRAGAYAKPREKDFHRVRAHFGLKAYEPRPSVP